MNYRKDSSVKDEDTSAEGDRLMDWLCALAFGETGLPFAEDGDSAADEDCLTQEDIQALNALGTSQELVERVVAAARSRKLAAAGEETQISGSAETEPKVSCKESRNPSEERPVDYLTLCQRFPSVLKSPDSGFQRLHELGRGAQGIVDLVKWGDCLGGEKAVKAYSPEPYGNTAAYQADMERFLTIAKRVHRVHHDNVINIQGGATIHGIYYMVMQWIDGLDLRRLLDQQLYDAVRAYVSAERWKFLSDVVYTPPVDGRSGLKPFVAVNIVEKCLRGLSALHELGITHGDIKPSNIMLDRYGSIRLIDLGSASLFEVPHQHRTWTPRYAPPEFLERGEWTPQSDLASLGYVLVELLSGRPIVKLPRVGDESTTICDADRDSALLAAKMRLPDELYKMLPEKVLEDQVLVAMIQKLIAPDPRNRFANAEAATDDQPHGAWHYLMHLVKGNLGVHAASVAKDWMVDVSQAARSTPEPSLK